MKFAPVDSYVYIKLFFQLDYLAFRSAPLDAIAESIMKLKNGSNWNRLSVAKWLGLQIGGE